MAATLNNFQRVGALSNAHAGSEFEQWIRTYFANQGVILTSNLGIPIVVSGTTKMHGFELGSDTRHVLVECKSRNLATGDTVPSAKMNGVDNAMFYFPIVPKAGPRSSRGLGIRLFQTYR